MQRWYPQRVVEEPVSDRLRRQNTFPNPSLGSYLVVVGQFIRVLLGIVLQAFQLLVFPFRKDQVALKMRARILNTVSEGDSTLEKR